METTKFGRYELLHRIGGGGMAEVFKARSSGFAGFEKTVAIKRILPNLAGNQEFLAMFVAEAKLSASLTHGNIAQVYEFGQVDNSYFIAMEYVNGRDLLAILKHFHSQRKTLPVPLSIYIILSVLSALDYAHGRKELSEGMGVIHRDVSPPNVLISLDGEVKLIDFGIAKARAQGGGGNLAGNIAYMSPEQATGQPLDVRSDLFSVGAILFECVVGRALFTGPTDLAILEQVRRAMVSPPTKINPLVPKPLEAIILKAVARDPSARFQSALELRGALESFVQSSRLTYNAKQLSRWMKTTFGVTGDAAAPSPSSTGPARGPRSTLPGFSQAGRAKIQTPVPRSATKKPAPPRVSELPSTEIEGVKDSSSFDDAMTPVRDPAKPKAAVRTQPGAKASPPAGGGWLDAAPAIPPSASDDPDSLETIAADMDEFDQPTQAGDGLPLSLLLEMEKAGEAAEAPGKSSVPGESSVPEETSVVEVAPAAEARPAAAPPPAVEAQEKGKEEEREKGKEEDKEPLALRTVKPRSREVAPAPVELPRLRARSRPLRATEPPRSRAQSRSLRSLAPSKALSEELEAPSSAPGQGVIAKPGGPPALASRPPLPEFATPAPATPAPAGQKSPAAHAAGGEGRSLEVETDPLSPLETADDDVADPPQVSRPGVLAPEGALPGAPDSEEEWDDGPTMLDSGAVFDMVKAQVAASQGDSASLVQIIDAPATTEMPIEDPLGEGVGWDFDEDALTANGVPRPAAAAAPPGEETNDLGEEAFTFSDPDEPTYDSFSSFETPISGAAGPEKGGGTSPYVATPYPGSAQLGAAPLAAAPLTASPPHRSKKLLWIGIAVLAVGLLIGGGVALWMVWGGEEALQEEPSAATPLSDAQVTGTDKGTQPKKTQPKKTQPKKTQPKKTQPKKTQPKKTQPKKTQPKKTQPKKTQPKKTAIRTAKTKPSKTRVKRRVTKRPRVKVKRGPPGYLLISSRPPAARIYIDGRNSGRRTPVGPASPLKLTPGKHKVSLLKAGRRFSFSVKIQSGKTIALVRTLPLP